MRYVLFALSLVSLLDSRLLAELKEFPAGSSNSLQIPAGASIQINGTSAKGDAAQYIKIRITISETSYDLNEHMYLNGLYINGPASLNVSPVTITPRNNIPYKLNKYGDIWKDPAGTGQFTERIDTWSWPSTDGASTVYNTAYQAYLDWKNLGNVPLPADAYTGNNIAGSGVLVDFTRYSNQPFRNILIPTGTTQTITVLAGKRIIICMGLNVNMMYGSPLTSSTTSTAEYGSEEFQPAGVIVKIKGYNIPSHEIEGPEELSVSYNQSTTTLGAGGSATTTSGYQVGPSFGIFTYYFADESSSPVSSFFVNDIASNILTTSGNYGLATKTQITTAIDEGKASGIASVRASPNTWSLFTTSQIQNMAVGDLVLTREVNGNFVLNYDIEQSTDLQTWTPYQALFTPLTGLPVDKSFVRIKIKNSANVPPPIVTGPGLSTPL